MKLKWQEAGDRLIADIDNTPSIFIIIPDIVEGTDDEFGLVIYQRISFNGESNASQVLLNVDADLKKLKSLATKYAKLIGESNWKSQ